MRASGMRLLLDESVPRPLRTSFPATFAGSNCPRVGMGRNRYPPRPCGGQRIRCAAHCRPWVRASAEQGRSAAPGRHHACRKQPTRRTSTAGPKAIDVLSVALQRRVPERHRPARSVVPGPAPWRTRSVQLGLEGAAACGGPRSSRHPSPTFVVRASSRRPAWSRGPEDDAGVLDSTSTQSRVSP